MVQTWQQGNHLGLLVYVDVLELTHLRLERKLGVRDLVHPVRPRERDGREQAYGRESSSAPTHCFSYIFFRLMHVSASRFFPLALNSLACLISFSIFRMRWSSRFCSISIWSRILEIAAFASFPPLLFAEGVGAAALGFERPNRFISARAGVRVHGENPRSRWDALQRAVR